MSSKPITFAPYLCSFFPYFILHQGLLTDGGKRLSFLGLHPILSAAPTERISLTVPSSVPKELIIMELTWVTCPTRNHLLYITRGICCSYWPCLGCIPIPTARWRQAMWESSSQTICTESGGGDSPRKILLLVPKDKKMDTGQAKANMYYRNILPAPLTPGSFLVYSLKQHSGCSLSRVLINTIFSIPLHYRLVPWASYQLASSYSTSVFTRWGSWRAEGLGQDRAEFRSDPGPRPLPAGTSKHRWPCHLGSPAE